MTTDLAMTLLIVFGVGIPAIPMLYICHRLDKYYERQRKDMNRRLKEAGLI